MAGLRHLFQDMDANGDGALTLAELQAALKSRRLNLTAQQAEVRSPPVLMPLGHRLLVTRSSMFCLIWLLLCAYQLTCVPPKK